MNATSTGLSNRDAAADVAPEIAALIRNPEHMKFGLLCYLAEQAIIHVRETLDQTDGMAGLTAHQAFRTITSNALQAAEDALRHRIGASRPLTNVLNACVTDQHEWYRSTAHHPASVALTELRRDFSNQYGFPVITADAVHRLSETMRGRQVLEVGAGNGYLAKQLQDAGVDLFPTDPHHPSASGYHLGSTQHTTIIKADAALAIRELPEMDLLWSWPTRDKASGLALQDFSGEILIYIGEEHDGCTGGDLFHEILEQDFHTPEIIPIPSFPHINDCIGIYRRH